MQDSPLIIIAFLIFLFVLWVYTGGPTRPISFAGPYLTPVTTSGDESEGYYADADRAFWRSFERSVPGASRSSGTVPAATGGVRIAGGDPDAEDSGTESIELVNGGSVPVAITGWVLQSARTGVSVRIPSAERIARSGEESTVILAPGGRAIVTTGRSPIRTSFAETTCTGYLDASSRFTPPLTQNCPSPIDELAVHYRENADRFDRCAAYVRTLPFCREARSVPQSVPSSCEDFVDDRLSYTGCVRSHQNSADFLTGTWRVFLGRERQLWRSEAETILLLDAAGREVDRYAY
jgi:hypothetical protein